MTRNTYRMSVFAKITIYSQGEPNANTYRKSSILIACKYANNLTKYCIILRYYTSTAILTLDIQICLIILKICVYS